MGHRGAPSEKLGSPRNPEGGDLSGIFRQGTETVKAGVMEGKYSSNKLRTRQARQDAGRGKAAKRGVRNEMERKTRVAAQPSASLTVQVLFLRPHDLVGRGLAYCLGYGGAGDTVLGSGDTVRQALAGHLCGFSATLPVPQPAGTGTPKRRRTPTPHRTPYPHRLLLRPPAWGGAQGRALPPRPERTGSCHPRGQARCRVLPCPRLTSAHPSPGQLEPGRVKRDRQLQENGGARLHLGAFRAAPRHVTRAPPPPPSPAPFPSLSF